VQTQWDGERIPCITPTAAVLDCFATLAAARPECQAAHPTVRIHRLLAPTIFSRIGLQMHSSCTLPLPQLNMTVNTVADVAEQIANAPPRVAT
jgi:hypothetical protein